MFLFILLAALAFVGIVGTLVLIPQGQDNRFSERQHANPYQNRIL